MALIEKAALLARLSPPLDALMCEQLLDEFISLERRYVLSDWEPAELDGGQFAEILARIIYHNDSGTLNRAKGFDDCVKYLENDTNGVSHSITPRHDAIHIARVLRTIYKFRSQRGAVHISASYSANQMDAKLMVECARWLMMETLRLFSQQAQDQAAKTIRELLQFDVPCVGKFEEVIIVQRTDLTGEEEVLVLLHYSGDTGFTRTELGKYAQCSAPSVTRAVQKLLSSAFRQIVEVNGRLKLTGLGSKRIREQLSHKLLLE